MYSIRKGRPTSILRFRPARSLEQARKALADAGEFIQRAGGVANAEKALSVLDDLREKIGGTV